MRCFIALDLPAEFRDDTAALARQLSAVVGGRFMPRESYHVTLSFLGEMGEAESRDAIAAIECACEGVEPFELAAEALGHFGKPHDATLWLGLRSTPELQTIAEALREELDRVGLDYDKKAFKPHITLARRARLPKGALPQLIFPQPAYAQSITLYKSTLTQAGATYKPLYTCHLSNYFSVD